MSSSLLSIESVGREEQTSHSLYESTVMHVLYSLFRPGYQYQQKQHHAAPWQLCVQGGVSLHCKCMVTIVSEK